MTINGMPLTKSQEMTLYVALGNFTIGNSEVGALGDDEHGETMRKLYIERTNELIKIINQKQRRNQQ